LHVFLNADTVPVPQPSFAGEQGVWVCSKSWKLF
jgi:hypothetical protein